MPPAKRSTNSVATSSDVVTVCSKLPFDFRAEAGGKTVVFNGAKGFDVTGEAVLLGGFMLTPGVPKDFWDAWVEQAGDFAALANGTIFAADPAQALDESKELDPEVTTGLEQKSEDELGVQVVKEG